MASLKVFFETLDWCCQYLNTLTAETACSPAEADLMCVTNGHISSQKITLMFFIMKIPGPDLITKVLWRNLPKHQTKMAVIWLMGTMKYSVGIILKSHYKKCFLMVLMEKANYSY